jgi:hypothetical protein
MFIEITTQSSLLQLCWSLKYYLESIHKFILITNYVSYAEISNFSQGQGNQGIARRRISWYVAQGIPQIDPREIGSAPMK